MKRHKSKRAAEPAAPPPRWKGIIVISKDGSRVSVHKTRERDGTRTDLKKLRAVIDREFHTEAPHRVFYAIEKRDEPAQ